jgi:ubiquinone/menaquinone biosynthesis C-methylase UbiE
MTTAAKFWDNISEKYAKDPIKDMEAYTYTLERTRSYFRESDRVVELGCGTGSTALLLADSVAEYLGTDLSSGMIAIARKKAIEADIASLSFDVVSAENGLGGKDGLDALLGFNLLHLVEDMPAVLPDAHDALRPGGLLITKTVCLASAGFKYKLMLKLIPIMQFFGKAPFISSFTTAQYDKMVQAAGFEIIESGNHPVNPPSRYVVARKV